MGLFDIFTKHILKTAEPVPSQNSSQLTAAEKESIVVQRVTTQDMVQFTSMPYHLDCEVKKLDIPQARPFAYIDLDQRNIAIAEAEMAKLNVFLISAHLLCKKVPAGIGIPVKDIVYSSSNGSAYTRLICTPHTFSGKNSKYPLSLTFMTDLQGSMNTTHGEMFYGQKGTVQKAKVCCWRAGKGYIFYFKEEGCNLLLSKIEVSDTSGTTAVAYQRPTTK